MSVSGVYGTTTINCNLAVYKAKTKKDGVYRLRGLCYRVRGGCVTHFAAYGDVYEKSYGFLISVGSYKHCSSDDGVKTLKNI
jgi:hypothetical protein